MIKQFSGRWEWASLLRARRRSLSCVYTVNAVRLPNVLTWILFACFRLFAPSFSLSPVSHFYSVFLLCLFSNAQHLNRIDIKKKKDDVWYNLNTYLSDAFKLLIIVGVFFHAACYLLSTTYLLYFFCFFIFFIISFFLLISMTNVAEEFYKWYCLRIMKGSFHSNTKMWEMQWSCQYENAMTLTMHKEQWEAFKINYICFRVWDK